MATIRTVDQADMQSIRELDKLGFLADFTEGPHSAEVQLYSFQGALGAEPLHRIQAATKAEAFEKAIAFAKEQA